MNKLLCLCLTLTACGGDIVAPAPDAPVGIADGSDIDVPIGDTGGVVDGGGMPDSSATPDVTSVPDATETPDAPVVPDAMPAPDAMPPITVECGPTTCTTPDFCCVTDGPTGPLESCGPASSCTGDFLTCDGPEDCTPGLSVCCLTAGTSCTLAATCALRTCHSDADCIGAIGPVCCPSPLGYGPDLCLPFCL